jgi:hypothetical protein
MSVLARLLITPVKKLNALLDGSRLVSDMASNLAADGWTPSEINELDDLFRFELKCILEFIRLSNLLRDASKAVARYAVRLHSLADNVLEEAPRAHPWAELRRHVSRCPIGYHAGRVVTHRSTNAAEIIEWIDELKRLVDEVG